jgi:hypothetical protein
VDRIIAFVRHKMNDDRDECLHGSLANFDDIFDYFPYRKRPDGGALVPAARRERASEIRPNLRALVSVIQAFMIVDKPCTSRLWAVDLYQLRKCAFALSATASLPVVEKVHDGTMATMAIFPRAVPVVSSAGMINAHAEATDQCRAQARAKERYGRTVK